MQDCRRRALRSQIVLQHLGVACARDHRVNRLKLDALAKQQIDLPMRGQGDHLEAIAMPRNDIKRVDADTAGGTENGKLPRLAHRNIRPASGNADVSASIRSSIPPWPGKIAPLSLTPALRFNHDSKRSPTMLKTVIPKNV